MRKNAATNWKYSKSYYQVNPNQTEITKFLLLHFQGQFLKSKATFPTPFQTIYYIAYFVYKCKNGQQRNPRKVDKEKEKGKEYLKLLKKLIDIQQQNELENTDEEKLADLRKDMKLDIEQMKNEIIAMK